MAERPKLHVWITKYALTEGIFECEADQCVDTSDKMIKSGHTYYHKPHWHTSEAEAKQRVLAMIAAKEKSIRKILKKIEELKKKFGAGS
jgi:hypothetical protein